jgi:hypothetical protein
MGRRPSQPDMQVDSSMPVIFDEPIDDIGSDSSFDTSESPVSDMPPVVTYGSDDIVNALRSAPTFKEGSFSDNTFDLMPSAHQDTVRDNESNPLSDLEMTTRAFRSNVNLEDDDEGEEDGEEGFGEGEGADADEQAERDFLLSEDEEEGEEAGDTDEEGEDANEDDGADELEDGTPAPKTRKTAADKAIEERIAAQEKAFNDRLAEMQKVLDANLAEVQKAKAEALAEKQELSLQSERQKQVSIAEAEVRAKFVDLEELDNDAFRELVDARVSRWEGGRREELGKQAAQEAQKANAEFQAQQVQLQRQQSYASYKANLPKGHELMGVEAIDGQGTWADLTAEMHEALSVAGLEVPNFADFASNFAPMLQAVHQRGFKAGAAKATARAARGKSAPPPVSGEGGGTQATAKSTGKPSFQIPTSLANWVPNYLGDMQGKRGR